VEHSRSVAVLCYMDAQIGATEKEILNRAQSNLQPVVLTCYRAPGNTFLSLLSQEGLEGLFKYVMGLLEMFARPPPAFQRDYTPPWGRLQDAT
jgi:hypothetical protein